MKEDSVISFDRFGAVMGDVITAKNVCKYSSTSSDVFSAFR